MDTTNTARSTAQGEQMPVHEDAQLTIAFIEESAAAKKPFFVNLWIHEPHTPFDPVPKYEWRFREMESRQDHIYASVLVHADDRIGEVLAALDRPGLAENTLIIFNSDNGPARSLKPTKLELQYDNATGAFAFLLAAKAALVHFDLALERRFILGGVMDDLPQPMKVKSRLGLVHSHQCCA